MGIKDLTVTEFSELLMDNIQGGTSLSNVIDMVGKFTSKLEHHKDTTIGLWAIDKNPKEVSKEWIEKNAFQIKY